MSKQDFDKTLDLIEQENRELERANREIEQKTAEVTRDMLDLAVDLLKDRRENTEECICGLGEKCVCEQPCFPSDLARLEENHGAAAEEAKPIRFEILVSTASDWPQSCEGVKPVLAAVQRLLVAAAEGKERDFEYAIFDLEEATDLWHRGLFGFTEKP